MERLALEKPGRERLLLGWPPTVTTGSLALKILRDYLTRGFRRKPFSSFHLTEGSRKVMSNFTNHSSQKAKDRRDGALVSRTPHPYVQWGGSIEFRRLPKITVTESNFTRDYSYD
jgi:hypothetical protein